MQLENPLGNPAALEHQIRRVRVRPAEHVLLQVVGQRGGEGREAPDLIRLRDDDVDRQREAERRLRERQPLADRGAHRLHPPLPRVVDQQRRRHGDDDAVDRPPRAVAFDQPEQRVPAAQIAAIVGERERRRHVDDHSALEERPGEAVGVGGVGGPARRGDRGFNRAGEQRCLAGAGGTDEEVPGDAVARVDAADDRAQPLHRLREGRTQLAHQQRRRGTVLLHRLRRGEVGLLDRRVLARARDDHGEDDRHDDDDHEEDAEDPPHGCQGRSSAVERSIIESICVYSGCVSRIHIACETSSQTAIAPAAAHHQIRGLPSRRPVPMASVLS